MVQRTSKQTQTNRKQNCVLVVICHMFFMNLNITSDKRKKEWMKKMKRGKTFFFYFVFFLCFYFCFIYLIIAYVRRLMYLRISCFLYVCFVFISFQPFKRGSCFCFLFLKRLSVYFFVCFCFVLFYYVF